MPTKRTKKRHRKAAKDSEAGKRRTLGAAPPADAGKGQVSSRRGGARGRSGAPKASERAAIREVDAASRELAGLAEPGGDARRFVERLSQLLAGGGAFSLFDHPELGALEAEALARPLGPARARELAGELCASGLSGGPQWWAVGLYRGAGDVAAAEQVATAAWEAAVRGWRSEADAAETSHEARQPEPDLVTAAERSAVPLAEDTAEPGELAAMARMVAGLRLELGRAAEAAELALELCAEGPADAENVEVFARAVSAIYDSHQRGDAEEAILARFADRSRLERLREAIAEFVQARPDLESRLAEERAEWVETFLDEAGVDDLDRLTGQHPFAVDPGPGGQADEGLAAAYELLAAENIWALGAALEREEGEGSPGGGHADEDVEDAAGDEGDNSDEEDEDDELRYLLGEERFPGPLSVLERFAAAPDSPLDLAVLAKEWQEGSRYGLWQVADPKASPGVWVTDIVTRRSIYVSMPPAHLEKLPRWSVLAGFFLPDRGIWRSGGAFAVLGPWEGDRAAEVAWALVANMMGTMAKELRLKGSKRLKAFEPRLQEAPPYGVIATAGEPLEDHLAELFGTAMLVALPHILGKAWDLRRQGPKMVNTDREPLEFFKLTAKVADAGQLQSALGKRPDFEVGPDGTVTWLGRHMTTMETETAMAELQEMMAAQGFGPVEPPDGPQRWARGVIRIVGDRATVEVNSRERLEKITQILERLGVSEPVVERQFNPELDMAFPPGWRPFARAGSPGAEEVWLRNWLDERVPVLGTTPRLAARDPKTAMLLEQLLRQFEFDADVARYAGERPLDVEKVRASLAGEDGRPFRFP